MNTEIQTQLHELALKRSLPFCYNDYIECPDGRCPKCGSDDLMRMLHGVGCEWGTDWVIKSILETELTPVDLDEEFEESIRQCYPETTKVSWMEFDTVSIMKEQDPISWRLARDEYVDSLEQDEELISFNSGSSYYWKHEIELLLERSI